MVMLIPWEGTLEILRNGTTLGQMCPFHYSYCICGCHQDITLGPLRRQGRHQRNCQLTGHVFGVGKVSGSIFSINHKTQNHKEWKRTKLKIKEKFKGVGNLHKQESREKRSNRLCSLELQAGIQT